MSIKWIIAAICFLGICACKNSQPAPDCARFKKGSFSSEISGAKYITERSDSFQTETIVKNGITVKLSIKWLNDCEYELRYLNTIKGDSNYFSDYSKSIVIKARIVATTANSYTYETGDVDNKLPKTKGTMFVMGSAATR